MTFRTNVRSCSTVQQKTQLIKSEWISVPATTAAMLDDEEAWRARSAKRDFFEYASKRFFMSTFSRSRLSMSFWSASMVSSYSLKIESKPHEMYYIWNSYWVRGCPPVSPHDEFAPTSTELDRVRHHPDRVENLGVNSIKLGVYVCMFDKVSCWKCE